MSTLPADTTAYVVEYQETRSRLSTFFRVFTVLPHYIYLSLYAIPVLFVIIAAWFTVVITAEFPERMYNYIERFERYATFVYSYMYLATDTFPPFNGRPDTPYQAQFLLGPPKAKYSRAKAFFRLILVIPFAIVAYAFNIIAEIGAIAAWFVIVFTGKIPRGLHDFIALGLSYIIRLWPFYYLQTEDWPKFTDQAVAEQIAQATALHVVVALLAEHRTQAARIHALGVDAVSQEAHHDGRQNLQDLTHLGGIHAGGLAKLALRLLLIATEDVPQDAATVKL